MESQQYDAADLERSYVACEAVGRHYERVIQNCDPTTGRSSVCGPWIDRVIYLVMVIRCDMDQNGFSSLIQQSLSLDDLRFVVDAFERLEEKELAVEFQLVLEATVTSGYELNKCGYQIDDPLWDQLEAIGERIREIGRLWSIDEKLLKLIPVDCFGP